VAATRRRPDRAAPAPPAARRPRRPSQRQRRRFPRASLLVGALAVVGAVGGGFVAATRTPLFALRAIDVRGGSPTLAAEVRSALRSIVGTSLVRIDSGSVARRLEALPEVLAVRTDRAFPHTLRIVVRAERPVAVLRQGRRSWLVSARGRVLRPLARPSLSALPRIWVGARAAIVPGRILGIGDGGRAARALAALGPAPLPARVRSARADAHSLAFVLRSGLQLRLGSPDELRLKLAIARRILRGNPSFGYLDVSVPERPVAGPKAQVGG
jgi:cell division protein FtsQ